MSHEKNGNGTTNDEGLALAPPLQNPLLAAFGNQAGADVCSFDLKTPAGRELLQKCEEAPDESLRSMIGKRLVVVHVYGKVIELPHPETGELVPCMRVCVGTVDGKVYACVSEGVRQAVGRLIKGHGLPPWKEGVPVEVTLKQTGNKRSWLTLLEVFDKPAAGGGRK